jgi:hypothetical protein
MKIQLFEISKLGESNKIKPYLKSMNKSKWHSKIKGIKLPYVISANIFFLET